MTEMRPLTYRVSSREIKKKKLFFTTLKMKKMRKMKFLVFERGWMEWPLDQLDINVHTH